MWNAWLAWCGSIARLNFNTINIQEGWSYGIALFPENREKAFLCVNAQAAIPKPNRHGTNPGAQQCWSHGVVLSPEKGPKTLEEISTPVSSNTMKVLVWSLETAVRFNEADLGCPKGRNGRESRRAVSFESQCIGHSDWERVQTEVFAGIGRTSPADIGVADCETLIIRAGRVQEYIPIAIVCRRRRSLIGCLGPSENNQRTPM